MAQARQGTALNSLGFTRSPGSTRVIVAMSGGVDSSVVAAMLAREGYDVIGITLQLYDHGAALARKGACCAGADIHDARRVAAEIGIPHYVLDYESIFRESVIDEFADSYLSGATPVPCIRCNERVKFRDLMNTARNLGGDCLATGHYVRRISRGNGPELHAATDPARDQSYFLFATTRNQLEYLRFPLGTLSSKAETRELARELGLAVSEKPDSQDICFVPDGDYASVIKKLRPNAANPGRIVDMQGTELGMHAGVIHFTVGQRRGLGIGGREEPLYVIRLDPDKRLVVVGPRSALESTTVSVGEVNWIGSGSFDDEIERDARVKIRSTRPAVPATVRPMGKGRAEIGLHSPESGISPGQACVFYAPDSSRVLGGGWIYNGQDQVGASSAHDRIT